MNAKSKRPNLRRYLADRNLVIAAIAALIAVAVAILARGDRILRINYESDQSRFEVNSSPQGSPEP
jgi:uncharacterized membrane protein YciS (DUF1049 family)